MARSAEVVVMVGMPGWKPAVDPTGGVADVVVVAEGGSMVMDMCGLLTVVRCWQQGAERRPIPLRLLMSLSTVVFGIVRARGVKENEAREQRDEKDAQKA